MNLGIEHNNKNGPTSKSRFLGIINQASGLYYIVLLYDIVCLRLVL